MPSCFSDSRGKVRASRDRSKKEATDEPRSFHSDRTTCADTATAGGLGTLGGISHMAERAGAPICAERSEGSEEYPLQVGAGGMKEPTDAARRRVSPGFRSFERSAIQVFEPPPFSASHAA